jgi:hypothetical protein
MNETDPRPRRAASGRFLPGQSGNPAGKAPGTRNRASLLREALRDGEDAGVARIIIDKALAGNSVMARFVIGLLIPRARDRAIEIDLPDCATAEGVLAASSATIQAMASGEITPEEALSVTRLLEFRLKAIAAAGERERLTPTHRRESSPTALQEPSPFAQQSPSPLAPGVASPRLPRQRGPEVPARAGEGRGEGVAAEFVSSLKQPPHPPIAAAMGPSLSRKGRGAFLRNGREEVSLHRRVETLEDLLHSTCISRPPFPFGAASPTPLPPFLTGAALAA